MSCSHRDPAGVTEFAIVGAGAIGSILGAHLARSGRKVVMIARGQRAAHVRRLGLQISGLATFSERVPVLIDASELKRAAVLIVAIKSYDTSAVLAALRNANIEVAFSIQNGLMKNEQLVATWGQQRVLGALANCSGELLPTGEVLFTRNQEICVGELSGDHSERTAGIAAIMDASGIHTTAVAEIQSLEWSKFAAWVGLMGVAVTTRAASWQYLSDNNSAWVVVRLIREVGNLATAAGVTLSDHSPLPVRAIMRSSDSDAVALVKSVAADLKANAPRHRMSSLQDLEAGRPLEVEETLGFASRMASELKLSCPVLECVYRLVAGIDCISRAIPEEASTT
jgi:2-dehydropantoate 2-reductase